MKRVDFFIVGQPKSGTSALAAFLDQHPEIAISVPKETGYMSKDHAAESDKFHGRPKYFHIRTPGQYKAVFAHAEAGQLLGDASTNYLFSKVAAAEIAKYNPEAKIIIMLRNPVDMIYALYTQYRNENKEKVKSFEEVLKLEKVRKSGKSLSKNAVTPSYYQYREQGLYAEQVERYIKNFDRKQILLIISEDFSKDNAKCYKDVLKFLNVKDINFLPHFKQVNSSKLPRSNVLNKVMHSYQVKKLFFNLVGQQKYTKVQREVAEPLLYKTVSRKDLSPSLRTQLERYFKRDLEKLSDILGLNLLEKWFAQPEDQDSNVSQQSLESNS